MENTFETKQQDGKPSTESIISDESGKLIFGMYLCNSLNCLQNKWHLVVKYLDFFLGRLIKYIPRMGQFCKIFVGYLGEGLAKGKQLDLWNFLNIWTGRIFVGYLGEGLT